MTATERPEIRSRARYGFRVMVNGVGSVVGNPIDVYGIHQISARRRDRKPDAASVRAVRNASRVNGVGLLIPDVADAAIDHQKITACSIGPVTRSSQLFERGWKRFQYR